MAANLVNLDALIAREDFEVVDDRGEWPATATLQIRDLEQSAFLYNALRKPDFQRETANWSPEKIAEFVKTFLDGDLIPAIILWKSGTNIFVIDGAHRLSALVAWVHDDYGDGKASRHYFENHIPKEQLTAADATRAEVRKTIGTYAEHMTAALHPERSSPEVTARARRLGTLALQLQWVNGDSKKAEASFFKINQEATPIDATELRILQSRNLPNAVAARAIVRCATGHKYWKAFPGDKQDEVEKLAKEIYEILFVPSLQTPIKTLDIPIAGRGYSAQALPLIFELVNLANGIKVVDATKNKHKKAAARPTAAKDERDASGEKTVQCLKNTRRLVYRISSTHPSSLGLHPAVYFYSLAGRYQQTSFLAVVSMFVAFESSNYFPVFSSVRRRFEEFIVTHKTFANQVTVKYGSGAKGFERLRSLYEIVIRKFHENASDEDLLTYLTESDFSYLKDVRDQELSSRRLDFDTAGKSATYLRDALAKPLRCAICGGLIHVNSITVDHAVRRQDGGLGVVENGQLAHPYCNTTLKN